MIDADLNESAAASTATDIKNFKAEINASLEEENKREEDENFAKREEEEEVKLEKITTAAEELAPQVEHKPVLLSERGSPGSNPVVLASHETEESGKESAKTAREGSNTTGIANAEATTTTSAASAQA